MAENAVFGLEMRGPTFDMGRDVGAHVFRIVGVDASEPALRVFVDGYGVTAQHGAPALRVVNPVGPQVPVPKTVVCAPDGNGVAAVAKNNENWMVVVDGTVWKNTFDMVWQPAWSNISPKRPWATATADTQTG